ncbi:MAG: hypothetical protein A2915_01025 [Candidatus Yanofskybacteria bacterium RIFCSPLOWO2_01_FULL_41_34]|nr:MAG: hypothetical protein A2915_01025 [Candidatus Yanofskybacteria bacterium RIFCSPLOWO2_01_FULL_41_34]
MPEEPTATQEPTEPTSEVAAVSEPLATSPVAPESPIEAESAVPVNNDNEQISPTEARNPATEQTVQIEEVEGNKPVSEATTQPTAQMAGNEPLAEPESKSPIPTEAYKNHTHENLTKAQLTIQEKKRKKLEKIIEALNTKGKITNDEVEKLLHVSDATATRYLSILEKEGKIKQSGRTGQSVSYSRI